LGKPYLSLLIKTISRKKKIIRQKKLSASGKFITGLMSNSIGTEQNQGTQQVQGNVLSD
jgi:hypothetical protein